MAEQRSLIHRSISGLLLLLILAFSLSSIGNVTEYIHQWHVGWWGFVLGIGFGAVVFICAYLASISVSWSNTWWIAIAVGTIFGLTSASFQASIYITGGAPLPTALALSFIPIVVGEVGLALLESSFSKDHIAQTESEHAKKLSELVSELNALDAKHTALIRETERRTTVANVQVEPVKTSEPITNDRPTGEDERKDELFDILKRERDGDLPKQKREDLYKQLGLTRTRMYELIREWNDTQDTIKNVPTIEVHTNGYHKEAA